MITNQYKKVKQDLLEVGNWLKNRKHFRMTVNMLVAHKYPFAHHVFIKV